MPVKQAFLVVVDLSNVLALLSDCFEDLLSDVFVVVVNMDSGLFDIIFKIVICDFENIWSSAGADSSSSWISSSSSSFFVVLDPVADDLAVPATKSSSHVLPPSGSRVLITVRMFKFSSVLSSANILRASLTVFHGLAAALMRSLFLSRSFRGADFGAPRGVRIHFLLFLLVLHFCHMGYSS